MEFTTEFEENNENNFYDLTISRINNEHTISISINRKHINSDIIIHGSSCHLYKQKMTAQDI